MRIGKSCELWVNHLEKRGPSHADSIPQNAAAAQGGRDILRACASREGMLYYKDKGGLHLPDDFLQDKGKFACESDWLNFC